MSSPERIFVQRRKKIAPPEPTSFEKMMTNATSASVVTRKIASVPAQVKKPRVEKQMPLEEKVIAFIETMKVPDGPDVGKLIILRDWQKDMIRAVYKPRMKNEKGKDVRAVRQALWTMARKNGKTSLAAGLIVCHLTGPCAVWNGQLFSVAFEVGQAALSYRAMQSMVMQDAELVGRIVLTDSAKRGVCTVSNSVFRSLSSESRSKHGLNPNFILYDELSQFGQDRRLFDVLMTSMGAQDEPLSVIISTQASEDSALLSELIDHGRAVNKKEIIDPSFHLTEYSLPPEMDAWNEKNWKLANPALGDFRSLEEMRAYAARAKSLPSMENSFRNLYLNQRVTPKALFVTEVAWALCLGDINLDELQGVKCWGGLDLSSKIDLTALVLVFDTEPRRTVVPFFFTPQNTVAERSKRDKVPYEKWIDLGYIEAVPGNAIDFRFVAQRLAELSAIFNIQAIGFDRWRIDVLKTWMDEYGIEINMLPIGQGFKDGSLMVEAVETALLNTEITHDNNPVLRWCALNTNVIKDPAGNRKFDKSSQTSRIDGFVALAMALRAIELCEAPIDLSNSILVI